MTRSSTNKLFTPYKEPEREFRSSRRHFKMLCLDKLRSPDFNLLSDQEYSEEEVTKTMVETIEQYTSKTRADYGSGVARPKIKNKDNFELKGQFLKELRTNTFSGSDHEDANEHIEKVLEIVDLFHILNITIDQVMLRAFPMSLTRAASRWLRNEPTGSIITWDGLKTKFLNKYCPPARTAKKMEEINNFQQESDENLYQAWERFKELLMKCPQHYLTEMQSMEDTLSKFMNESTKRHEENSKLIKEIRASTDVAIRNQGASIKTLEIQIGQVSKYAISTGQNRMLMYETRQTTIPFPSRLNGCYYKEKNGSYRLEFLEAYSKASQSIPQKEKDPGSFTLPCFINNVCFVNGLIDLGASVSVMPLLTYLNLGLGELAHTKLTSELADKMVKYLKGIAKNVLVRADEPFKLKRNQGDDLMPTIKEGKVSDEDKMNGISHLYQKLKGFYQGVLDLGPDYVRDARMEEWLTHGHISVHEME
nr:hypothetical protein [Tanacetum cinerariifolium]